jgi:ABC-type microcin C transport system permease subunit YejE
VVGQRKKLFGAIILAVILAFSLIGLTYLVFPDKTNQMPIPLPDLSTSVQISMAIYWLGVTAIVAIAIVGVLLVVQRIRRKISDKEIAVNS